LALPKGTTMHFTSEPRVDDVLVERDFAIGDIPGFLWTPASSSSPVPLVLLSHPGGLRPMYPRLVARARALASLGLAAASIELPGAGRSPALADVEQARTDLRRALADGDRPSEDVIDRLVLPLVDRAVPEWQTAVDELLELPEIGGPVGFSGGVTAIGVRLAFVEPRVVAAVLFAGSFVPRAIMEEARRVTIPLHVLLQWDDEGNDRQAALELFDALGSTEKALNANMGGHTGVPQHAGDSANRFLARHLG
jgi:dienelactone hydrolase